MGRVGATLIGSALLAGLGLSLITVGAGGGPTKNGFDVGEALISADAIVPGGPPRDGIPALDAPTFVGSEDAPYLQDGDRVLGLLRHGIARAYPIAILNWHEIVNDRVREEQVAITYCPLCGSGVAYVAEVHDRPLTFGVSGLLYNSDVLLYDRQTESLWSQILARAVSGPLKGQRLETIPIHHTTWSDWKTRHPDTTVLSRETGYRRDYTRDPYADYDKRAAVFFPVAAEDARFHPKEPVIGLEIEGTFKAYPFSELERTDGEVRDSVAGREVLVRFDPEHRTGSVHDASGQILPTITVYWFAWYAFHPDTAVFDAAGAR